MAKIYYGNQRIDGNEINTENIVDEAITNEKLADDAVSTSNVQNGSITENKLSAAVQEKLNREVGITDYDDLDNKPVANIYVDSEYDLYTDLSKNGVENGTMIRAQLTPNIGIATDTTYEANSDWYFNFISYYGTYDIEEERSSLIDDCQDVYEYHTADAEVKVAKLAAGTIVVNGETKSLALSYAQAYYPHADLYTDSCVLSEDYQGSPENADEYQILFNSYTGLRSPAVALDYDVRFNTIYQQDILDKIFVLSLAQNGYFIVDALHMRDGINFNEVLDKSKVKTIDGQSIVGEGDIDLKTINGESVIGSGDIKVTTFQPFKSSWPTSSSYTTSQFCAAVNNDADATIGMGYFGGAKWSDKPSGLSNCDVVVEVLQGPNANTKAIHLIITSGSVAPYTWEYTWWSGSSPKGWVSFKSSIVAGNNVQLSDDSNYRLVISATDTTYSAGNGLDLTNTEFSIDTTVVATQSDLQGKQDVLTAGANITIDGNNEISATDTTYSAGANISIDANNEISATDTTYTNGNGLNLSGTEFSIDTTVVATQSDLQGKQDVLTAGANIDITNNVISVTGNLGVTDYDDLDNKPVVNQDLDAIGFVPVANTYYRHIGSSGSAMSAFYQTEVLNQGDKIHFDTTKSSEMLTYLSSLTYQPDNPMVLLMSAPQSESGQAFNIAAASMNGIYLLLIIDGQGQYLVYDSSNGGFNNLDQDGNFTLHTESGTSYYYTVDTINDPNDDWNGVLIGTPNAPSTFVDGTIYFYDGTGYNQVIDRSMVDTVPTQGSTNLITSGAVYDALAGIEAILATI